MSLSFPFPHVNTKLHVPTTRPGLVARPRLSRQLDRCVQHKLLLICAPAGFGKTTLLSQWSQQSARPVAWVSLDASDKDPIHFWSYVVAALDKLEAGVGENVLPLIHTPHPEPVGYFIPALINSVAMIPDHFVLILDDYCCIESDAIHEALAYLIDYAPPNMHVILATAEPVHHGAQSQGPVSLSPTVRRLSARSTAPRPPDREHTRHRRRWTTLLHHRRRWLVQHHQKQPQERREQRSRSHSPPCWP